MNKLAPPKSFRPDPAEAEARRERFREACALQEIEGNPLTPDEIEMFEMFERERWSDDRCIAHITALAKARAHA